MKPYETKRMLIRDFCMEDTRDLHEILGDDIAMFNCEPAYDFDRTSKFLAAFCIERHGAVAAVEKQSDKVIGYILLNEFGAKVYEVGWIFNRNYWRQGYAYEACTAIIDYAFRELGAIKIFAETIDAAKSVGLMEKLGMTREGIQRNQTTDNAGNRADLYLYGMLREEWEKR